MESTRDKEAFHRASISLNNLGVHLLINGNIDGAAQSFQVASRLIDYLDGVSSNDKRSDLTQSVDFILKQNFAILDMGVTEDTLNTGSTFCRTIANLVYPKQVIQTLPVPNLIVGISTVDPIFIRKASLHDGYMHLCSATILYNFALVHVCSYGISQSNECLAKSVELFEASYDILRKRIINIGERNVDLYQRSLDLGLLILRYIVTIFSILGRQEDIDKYRQEVIEREGSRTICLITMIFSCASAA